MASFDSLRSFRLEGRSLLLLDQRLLPLREEWIRYDDAVEVAGAIRQMVVRGAPAIGCVAAHGLALAALGAPPERGAFLAAVQEAARVLGASRPTAVNLEWAIRRCLRALQLGLGRGVEAAREAALAEAEAIAEEDRTACRQMGQHTLALLPPRARILTHCNAGALATAGYGTALGAVRAAAEAGRLERVFASETRPRQQGARITAWELAREGLPVTVIADTAVGALMYGGEVNCVVVGADRIAACGDVANKIGTYQVAVLAAHHQIPFIVVAPESTLDPHCPDGSEIPIEERDPTEVSEIDGIRVVPPGVPCLNPAFDITPARFVTAIVTERGVARPPFGKGGTGSGPPPA
ncbi:MAG: S-methyl-5-thioribose-1-phosphate isomerase [Polyangia bacterium]|jgi:methylthioribose-1-phosphate isomerase|nr:S-methyl-5-thioribose-1-phosphate isomerase [Polyangia bacterium]